jgi:hypothetical protein
MVGSYNITTVLRFGVDVPSRLHLCAQYALSWSKTLGNAETVSAQIGFFSDCTTYMIGYDRLTQQVATSFDEWSLDTMMTNNWPLMKHLQSHPAAVHANIWSAIVAMPSCMAIMIAHMLPTKPSHSNIAIGPVPHRSGRRRERCSPVLASIVVIPGMRK